MVFTTSGQNELGATLLIPSGFSLSPETHQFKISNAVFTSIRRAGVT